uniref:Uncharacterized protein n=1 Tax=Cyclopterus lumpus TaxID=8103 RepID=A0A8C2X0Z2_CYCLU
MLKEVFVLGCLLSLALAQPVSGSTTKSPTVTTKSTTTTQSTATTQPIVIPQWFQALLALLRPR